MDFNHIEKINSKFKLHDNLNGLVQICERCLGTDNLVICEVCKMFFHVECDYKDNNIISCVYLCSNCKNFKPIHSILNKKEAIDDNNFDYSNFIKFYNNNNNLQNNPNVLISNLSTSCKNKLSIKYSNSKNLNVSNKRGRRPFKNSIINNKSNQINNNTNSSFTNVITKFNSSPSNKIISSNISNNDVNKPDTEKEVSCKKLRKKRQRLEDSIFYEMFEYSNNYNNNTGISNKNINSSSNNILKVQQNENNTYNHKVSILNKKTLRSFDNTDINYKKRKIRVGDNFNINVHQALNQERGELTSNSNYYYSLTNIIPYNSTNNYQLNSSLNIPNNNSINNSFNLGCLNTTYSNNNQQLKYTNNIIECFETTKPTKVYSAYSNPLSNNEIDQYLKDAFFFWDYENKTVETELCSEFYNYFNDYCQQIENYEFLQEADVKIKNLKYLMKKGINLNNHFEEIALKILHLCKYSIKKALYFLYKKINPYLEEEIICFKSDVYYMQREAFVLIKEFEQDN